MFRAVGRPDSAAAARSLFRAELALLLSALVVLLITALAASGGDVAPWERGTFRTINDLPGFLYPPVWVVMQFGSFWAIVAVGAVALAFRRFRLAIGLAISGLSVYLLAELLKAIVDRPRPAALLRDVQIRGAAPTGAGFPSGHAAVSCALAMIAWLWFGPRLRWTFIGAAVIVCFARVYVGAHLPLDIIGGAALGLASGALVGLVLKVRHHGHQHRVRLRRGPASAAG
jgi:membrane-associated phospholipid phosphatase